MGSAGRGSDLAPVEVPVEVRYSGHDVVVPPNHGDWLAGALPHAEVTCWPDHGHLGDAHVLDDLRALITACRLPWPGGSWVVREPLADLGPPGPEPTRRRPVVTVRSGDATPDLGRAWSGGGLSEQLEGPVRRPPCRWSDVRHCCDRLTRRGRPRGRRSSLGTEAPPLRPAPRAGRVTGKAPT